MKFDFGGMFRALKEEVGGLVDSIQKFDVKGITIRSISLAEVITWGFLGGRPQQQEGDQL